jgi:hypothetical protein
MASLRREYLGESDGGASSFSVATKFRSKGSVSRALALTVLGIRG